MSGKKLLTNAKNAAASPVAASHLTQHVTPITGSLLSMQIVGLGK